MRAKHAGTIVEWNPARGHGFVRSGSARIFLHRRDFVERRKVIEVGDRISFVMGADDRGRTCACEAAHLGFGGSLSLVQLVIVAVLLILPGMALSHAGPVPGLIWGGLAGVNVLTFLLYLRDKHRARDKGWRVPEAWLHLLELMGGWPAAFLSQRLLRHKTSKASYQLVFWLIVILWQVASYDLLHEGRWTARIAEEVKRLQD